MSSEFSAAMTAALHERLVTHLARADGQEDLTFALYYPSRGESRWSAILSEPILPGEEERAVHGNVEFFPLYFERALAAALGAGAGLAFLHSHPRGRGWQGLSRDDRRAEAGMAAALLAATGLPLVGLTLTTGDSTWSARVWQRISDRFVDTDCATVRVVGERLRTSFHPRLRPPPARRERLRRTTDAWGPQAQAGLARLRIGIAGAGTVGIPVAEALARTGLQWLRAVDFDIVKEHNLDRLLHAVQGHVRERTPKVMLLDEVLPEAATAEDFHFDPRVASVTSEEGYRALLDCDVIFSCVDRPWPRSVLQHIAYAHLIPVIDGGIAVSRLPDGRMRSAEWRAYVQTHAHRCGECLGQIDRSLVQADREGKLDDPTYIERLPSDHPIRSNENVFIFGLAAASLELLQLVMMVVTPAGLPSAGAQLYHFPSSTVDLDTASCESWCRMPEIEARGEMADDPGLAKATRRAPSGRELPRGRRAGAP